jgi:hypothetical protein
LTVWLEACGKFSYLLRERLTSHIVQDEENQLNPNPKAFLDFPILMKSNQNLLPFPLQANLMLYEEMKPELPFHRLHDLTEQVFDFILLR